MLLFALARTGVCAYRAAAQSITVDEATTYLNYVREHWANVWSNYDPNNHILYSILAQLSVRAFRVSEFSLRLPSVLAGFFLVIGIHRVLEQTVESRAVRWIALVGLSTAPLMLDFSVAARGYGLGLALLVWAIYFSVRGRDAWAGVFAGLSIAVVPSGMAGVRVSEFSGTHRGVLYPGLHMVTPLVDSLAIYDVHDKVYSTAAGEPMKKDKAGEASPPEVLKVQAKEGLPIGLAITVRYHLDAARLVYIHNTLPAAVDSEVVQPVIGSTFRGIAPNYTVARGVRRQA